MSGVHSGEGIARRAVEAAATEFGGDLAAAYLIGSLAHGGFAPLVSDVDVCLVLHAVDAGTAERVAGIGERVATPAPMTRRLSVFWSDPAGLRDGAGPHDRLPAADRLDLLDSGRLVHGEDQRSVGARRPTRRTLVVEAARFALTRFDDDAYRADLADPERLVDDGVRATTKAVLFPVRFLYTAATGRLGHNVDAASWYVGNGRRGAPLVDAGVRWRVDGLRGNALPLLREHLLGLYDEFADDHARRLETLGEPALAERLRRLAR